MRYLWTIIWAFLLSFVISYVLSAMASEPLAMTQVLVMTVIFSLAVIILGEGGLKNNTNES